MTGWLASPLAGTAAVLAGLAALAVPLLRLTSDAPAKPQVAAKAQSLTEIHAVLRVKLLAPAQILALRTTDGRMLLALSNPLAGESEYDVNLPFDGKTTELSLEADFPHAASETAVFLTVMPDGFDDQTRYVTGRGAIRETLRYQWPAH